MMSTFANILKVAVDRIPGAIGGSFAAWDGEMVDTYSKHPDPHEWAILTAHYGVLLSHVQAALNTLHHGEAELMVIQHNQLDILLHHVQEGYYALMAFGHPAPLPTAMAAITEAAGELRREMG